MEGQRSVAEAVVSTYRKAPVTLSIFASYFISRICSSLWLDYRLFVSLPGGPLPKNILGWSVHYFLLSPLSLHSAWTSTRLVRSFFPTTQQSNDQHLTTGVDLPQRKGPGPLAAGTIPHRQLDQFTCEPDDTVAPGQEASNDAGDASASKQQAQEAIQHILSTLKTDADSQPAHLRLGPSMIEAHSTALFAVSHTLVTGSENISRSTRSARFPSALSRRFLSSIKGEFVHMHCQSSAETHDKHAAWSEDGSLHMTLHPDDAALVIERGWGQLHPLAGFPSYSGFWFGWPAWLTRLRASAARSARWWTSRSIPTDANAKVAKAVGLPPTYCLVYSPRNMEEAKVLLDIIHAATAFAIGSRPTSR
ncbi:Glucosamine-6-phosphate deaminase [Pseudozyma hubeiensis]|nr:Glucosamine-6-phosphate deaminase [Pseudozyma hubeiensis]